MTESGDPPKTAAPAEGGQERKRRRRRRRPADGNAAAADSVQPTERSSKSGERRRRTRRGESRRRTRRGDGKGGPGSESREPTTSADGQERTSDDDTTPRRRRRRRRRADQSGPSSAAGDSGARTSGSVSDPSSGAQPTDADPPRRRRRRRRGADDTRSRDGDRSRAAQRRSRSARSRDADLPAEDAAHPANGETPIPNEQADERAAVASSRDDQPMATPQGHAQHDRPRGPRLARDASDYAAEDAGEDIVFEREATPPPRPDPAIDDPDPVSFELEQLDEDDSRPLDTDVRSIVGIKFSKAGRIYPFDSGNNHYRRGDTVLVDGERGTRTGEVAVASHRTVHRGKSLYRVLRRVNDNDRAKTERHRQRAAELLASIKAAVRRQGLAMKVFRAELNQSGKKVMVYFASQERVDFRPLVKRLTHELRVRVEMRQTGVRDEAKAVGGIGSCGRELCCTTWLPEFVPVSIKMAKDQGLVLNPTKVSGQCGRLKCCLVYEQENYAKLRKGLPKLGKRVITEAGDGRVVEVDVLRQRVRVSLGPGESRVFMGHEVKPMFPSQQPKSQAKKPAKTRTENDA